MTDAEVIARLQEIIRDVLDDEGVSITPTTKASDVKDWDSANHINIVVAVETRFKVRFSNADVDRLRNVGDFVDTIQAKLLKGGAR